MATAGDVIERAMKRILSQAADAPLEPDEYADALSDLNDFMSQLESRGISLGYTPVSNVGDTVTVPPGALLGIIANLAITIAPDYNGVISGSLSMQAKKGMQALRGLGAPMVQTSYPPTLPVGTGNRRWSGESYGYRFYRDIIAAKIAFSGNSAVTSIEDPDTPAIINGEWVKVTAKDMVTTVSGRITSTNKHAASVTISAALGATGTGDYLFMLMKNGQQIESSQVTLSDIPADVSFRSSVHLGTTEYVELWVQAVGHDADLVVQDALLEVI